jgi:hypothetical protein
MQEQELLVEEQEQADREQLSPTLLDMSPLVVAVNKGHNEIVQMLLNLLEQRKEEPPESPPAPFYEEGAEVPLSPTRARKGPRSAGRFVQWTGTKTLLPVSFKPAGIYVGDEFCALSTGSSSSEEEIALEHPDADSHEEDKEKDKEMEKSQGNEEPIHGHPPSSSLGKASTTSVIINNDEGSSGPRNRTITNSKPSVVLPAPINDNDNNDTSSIPNKYLIQVYNKALLHAIANKQEKVAQQLLDFGADPNFPCSSSYLSTFSFYPPPISYHSSSFACRVSSYSCLSLSVQMKLQEMVTLLLDYGANPLLPDPFGRSPVHLASKFGDNNEIFKILISRISSM